MLIDVLTEKWRNRRVELQESVFTFNGVGVRAAESGQAFNSWRLHS
jgi:hypothetical protein